jgi:hypothetical protein
MTDRDKLVAEIVHLKRELRLAHERARHLQARLIECENRLSQDRFDKHLPNQEERRL